MNYQVFFSRIIFSLIILILFFVSSTAKTEIVAIFGEDGEKGLTATGKKRAKNGKVGENAIASANTDDLLNRAIASVVDVRAQEKQGLTHKRTVLVMFLPHRILWLNYYLMD